MNILDDNYDISVDNMLDISKDQEQNGFKIKAGVFYSPTVFKKHKRNILVKDVNGYKHQIMSMNDGRFILEISDNIDTKYFYSNILKDLC